MRYFLAAALAVVLAIPPANVGAGIIGGDIFIMVGVDSEDNQESLFCGDLGGSKSWFAATISDAETVVVAGEGAKVGKGPRLKDKGDARRFEDPTAARPRGAVVKSDVQAIMKASYNAKTAAVSATVVDKTNGETIEVPGSSVDVIYLITNQTGDTTCAALIEGFEESGAFPKVERPLGR